LPKYDTRMIFVLDIAWE